MRGEQRRKSGLRVCLRGEEGRTANVRSGETTMADNQTMADGSFASAYVGNALLQSIAGRM